MDARINRIAYNHYQVITPEGIYDAESKQEAEDILDDIDAEETA